MTDTETRDQAIAILMKTEFIRCDSNYDRPHGWWDTPMISEATIAVDALIADGLLSDTTQMSIVRQWIAEQKADDSLRAWREHGRIFGAMDLEKRLAVSAVPVNPTKDNG